MSKWVIGVLGGSGLYELEGLEGGSWERASSPWGEPSDELFRGAIGEVELVFLPRHGRGHRLSPSHLNYRANIDVLKRAGCTDLLSISACGSLREDIAPGDFVVADQFIDRTHLRERSFFGDGVVAHVPMADPVSARLGEFAMRAAEPLDIRMHRSGTYVAIEGPQFSTRAESLMYRSWGCSVIGMTNMPEARLAREAELPYATIAMATDYDCWREEEEGVSVTDVVRVLQENASHARALIARIAGDLAGTPRTPDPQGIETVLDHALITAPSARNAELVGKLDAVGGRVLRRG